MNKSTHWVQSAAQLCLELGEEDGVDPRYLKNKMARKTQPNKAWQLCKEASRIFNLMLGGEINRPLLRDFQVLSVVPEPYGTALRVTVAHDGFCHEFTDAEIIAELNRVRGVLRCALAQAVNRRHTPRLTFVYAGAIQTKQGGG